MIRVLLCGEVRGKIGELHRLLGALQKKGPFDFALCVGPFFADSHGLSLPPECGNAPLNGERPLPPSPSERGLTDSALTEAVREAFARQFPEAFEALQTHCSSLALPLYIVDEAASLWVQEAREKRGRTISEADAAPFASSASERLSEVKAKISFPLPICPSGELSGESAREIGDASERDRRPAKPEKGAAEESAGEATADSLPSECLYTPLPLMEKVWLLAGSGVTELHGLHVAFYAAPGFREIPNCALEATPCQQQQQQPQQQPQQQQQQQLNEAASAESVPACWSAFKAFRGHTDIFLTTRPPVGIFEGLPPGIAPPLPQQQQKQQGVSLAAAAARHGYSLRLISLGVVGEKGPQVKAFHALQLRPMSCMLAALRQQGERHLEEDASTAALTSEEAQAALYCIPPECNSPNPFACASRQQQLRLLPSLEELSEDHCVPAPSAGCSLQVPHSRASKRPRDTGVVLVENLPYEIEDGGSLQEAMQQFGEVKFVFVPKDKACPSRGTGKAFVVFTSPQDAAKAAAASGQLEGGRRTLRMRLYYDRIPFDRPTGAKRVHCGDVIATEPHADCWFCLASPQVEKHMIVDIKDRLYMAVPKGGLTPYHLLLIPIAHLPSLAYADADTRREAAAIVAATRKAFHQQNLDLVVYERYVPMKATRAMHSQVHAVPCHRSQSMRAEALFEKRARRAGLVLKKMPTDADLTALAELARDPHLGYFYVELPGLCTARGQTIERYLYVQPGRDSQKIPMNFGREVLAELLEAHDKVNWQTCLVPKDEEEKLAAHLRQTLIDA
ncbi:uncharacterized protein LOC34618588 [Cyclospora cayetanensis]|uniref:Uncharacterized protein LOC34618588 n=1 Tax=Cyclospora cayetanensis TaxID=88456 RepID=A0A6P6S343_9EIME|nr:uncharacterized protein LOC34618588 [Cyclospora cayetanensis]